MENVNLDPAQLAAQIATMQARLSQLESEKAQQAVAAGEANARAMIARGEADAVLVQHRQQVAESRRRAEQYAISTTLTAELAKVPLVPHALQQLHSLFSHDLAADPSADGFTVRSKDYRPVGDYVAARLADPNFQHFRADRRPAAPAQPASPVANPADPFGGMEPKNLGEQIVMLTASNPRMTPTTDPRSDMSRPMGLKRAR